MKNKLLLLAAMLFAILSLNSCANNTASDEISESPGTVATDGSESVFTEAPESGKTAAENSSEVSENLPALRLDEPDRDESSDEVSLIIFMDQYPYKGVIENAEGEKLYYPTPAYGNTMEVLDKNSVAYAPYGGIDTFVVKYSDSFKVKPENGLFSINCGFGERYIVIECSEGENVEMMVTEAGNKATIAGNAVKWRMTVPLYYYYAEEDLNNENSDRTRIYSVSIGGRTDGSVALEKKEDGWYLSGADGEVTVEADGDSSYNAAHSELVNDSGFVEVKVDAPADGVIHIEEYIPEVQEMCR